MSEDPSFGDLIRRVRAGEEEAATQLVRRYEPTIRRIVDVRLRDPRLRRLLDAEDVCQSVLASFFVRAAMGQYRLDTPEQLVRLLATMARNKLANQVHRHQAQRCDYRRVTTGTVEEREIAAPDPSLSTETSSAKLLQDARQRLSAEERRLLELRQEGRSWAEIAAALGGSPDGLRMQLTRAVDRVARELGLDEVAHE
jgi:RNA polymerase sigma-70 factor (ECF subfamily)